MTEKGPVHQPDDKALKAVLYSKKAFMQLLRYFLDTDWSQQIDEQSLIRIDKSYVLNDFAAIEADIVYQCRINGQETVFYVLLELQSTVDHQMPWRLLQYMVEIWRSWIKDEAVKQRRNTTFRLPAIVPVVLYVGDAVWTAKCSFKEYLANGDLFGSHVIDFNYHLVDVKRWSPDDLIQLKGVLPILLRMEQAGKSEALLRLFENSVLALGNLDEDELGMMNEYITRVLLQICSESKAEEIVLALKDAKGGSEMISNVTRILKEEFDKKAIEATNKGLREGKIEGHRELISRMQQRGMTIERIADVTGLTVVELTDMMEEGEKPPSSTNH